MSRGVLTPSDQHNPRTQSMSNTHLLNELCNIFPLLVSFSWLNNDPGHCIWGREHRLYSLAPIVTLCTKHKLYNNGGVILSDLVLQINTCCLESVAFSLSVVTPPSLPVWKEGEGHSERVLYIPISAYCHCFDDKGTYSYFLSLNIFT